MREGTLPFPNSYSQGKAGRQTPGEERTPLFVASPKGDSNCPPGKNQHVSSITNLSCKIHEAY